MEDHTTSSIESTSKGKLKKTNPNKPTNKKKVTPSIPKKNLILQYFKQKNIDDINQSTNGQQRHAEKNDFYKNCLKSKVNLCAAEKNCHEIKQSLKGKLDINTHKEAQIQESIAKCLEICKQKDDKIKSLENQTEQIHQLSATSTSNNTSTSTQTNMMKNPTLFEDFNGMLAEKQLGTLRSIDKSTKGDSTFVLNCVRFFYSHDLAKLAHKSVTGASKGEPKEPITPQKLDQMKTIYVERLNDLKIVETEKEKRERKFNNHVHRAIININTAQKNGKENIKVINFTK